MMTRGLIGFVTLSFLGGFTTFIQAEEPANIFKSLDKNGDGVLTKKEVGSSRKRFYDRLIRIGDKNKDGKLSREEFIAAGTRTAPKVSNTPSFGRRTDRRPQNFNPGQFFDRLDRNKDGKLTLTELPASLRPRLKPLFDRSKKQSLTKQEFLQLSRRSGNRSRFTQTVFNQLDKNKDKKLTLDEVSRQFRLRFKPLFDRSDKKALTYQEIVRLQQRFNSPAEARRRNTAFFTRLDTNKDGKISLKEVPERARPFVGQIFKRAGKGTDGTLTKEEFLKASPPRPRPKQN